MSVERIDYSTDDDFRQALQQEEQEEYRHQEISEAEREQAEAEMVCWQSVTHIKTCKKCRLELGIIDCARCNDAGCPLCDGTKGSKYNPEPY